MKKEMICITCPMSCHLVIDIENNEILSVEGNTCPRGKEYAINEILHPVRILTSTVVIHHALNSRLPVITSKPVPFDQMNHVMEEINRIVVTAPIHVKDVVINNVCGLDVDIIASRSMERID